MALRWARGRGALLVHNSLANLLRAGSTSLVTILLPVILVVIMPVQSYAAWALIFSLASYAIYLDLGLQSTVQALVGRSDGEAGRAAAFAIGRSAIRVIGSVFVVAAIAAWVLASQLPTIFPDIPVALVSQSRVALAVAIIGQASSLVGSTIAAYFAGKQRSFEATAVIAPSRLVSMLASVAAAALSGNLMVIAICFSSPLVVGSLVLAARFWAEQRRAPVGELSAADRSATTAAYLLRYSGPLIIWSICMLVVTGVDLALVGRLDYGSLAPYAVAAMIATGLAGVGSALTSPLLPEFARRAASGTRAAFSRVVLEGTGLNSAAVIMVATVLIAYSPWLMEFLLRDAGAASAVEILAVLLAANALRMTMTPLTLAFIATKTHSRIVLPPVVEAAVNLGLSIVLGLMMGAIGIAWGTLIGAVVGVALASTWSLKASGAVAIATGRLWVEALWKPCIAIAPLAVCIVWMHLSGTSGTAVGLAIVTAGLLGALPLQWRFVLTASAKELLRSRILRRTPSTPPAG
jgi:O-antigen/teichoic acid export membrane protein